MSSSLNKSNAIDIDFTASPGLAHFLSSLKISLVISTYQTGNVFFIGTKSQEALAINPITLKRPMGLYVQGKSLYIGDRFQIWRFNNIVPAGQRHAEHDAIYIPQVSWTTADLDAHDIVIESSGRLVFVNTLFSCLAATSEESSFKQIWKPPCISKITHEDRCHLNGLALRSGKIRYATAFSRSDTAQGWRNEKYKQGVIWDIEANKIILDALNMPHSPRWYADKLWCLESGSGTLNYVDFDKKKLVKVASLPGYLRGLNFHGEFAFIASSIPRADSTIKDQKLIDEINARGEKETCGIFILHLPTAKLVHFIKVSVDVQELYDVAVLSGVLNPKAYSIDSEEVQHMLNIV